MTGRYGSTLLVAVLYGAGGEMLGVSVVDTGDPQVLVLAAGPAEAAAVYVLADPDVAAADVFDGVSIGRPMLHQTPEVGRSPALGWC